MKESSWTSTPGPAKTEPKATERCQSASLWQTFSISFSRISRDGSAEWQVFCTVRNRNVEVSWGIPNRILGTACFRIIGQIHRVAATSSPAAVQKGLIVFWREILGDDGGRCGCFLCYTECICAEHFHSDTSQGLTAFTVTTTRRLGLPYGFREKEQTHGSTRQTCKRKALLVVKFGHYRLNLVVLEFQHTKLPPQHFVFFM
jgi:hypothetical protein